MSRWLDLWQQSKTEFPIRKTLEAEQTYLRVKKILPAKISFQSGFLIKGRKQVEIFLQKTFDSCRYFFCLGSNGFWLELKAQAHSYMEHFLEKDLSWIRLSSQPWVEDSIAKVRVEKLAIERWKGPRLGSLS